MADWTLYRETEPTARKRHQCDGCHGTIRPGETYTRARGLYDGRWETSIHCGHCVPVEENVAGAYRRPAQMFDDALGDSFVAEWDGNTIILYGLEVTATGTRHALYETTLIPRVGLTDWSLVAREEANGFGWSYTHEDNDD